MARSPSIRRPRGCKKLRFAGTLAAEAEVVVPDNRKPYFVQNGTTGGFAVKVRTAAGGVVEVPGTGGSNTGVAYCDGAPVIGMSSGTVADDVETQTVYYPVTIGNPGAESGSIANWTSEAGSWSSSTNAGSMSAAHSGSRFFYNESGANGVLTQTLDLAVDGFSASELETDAVFRLTAWTGAAHGSDTGVLEIDWLDAADQVLDSATSGEIGPSSPLGTWDEVVLTGLVPIGARKARIRLRTVNHFGSNSTYCFDDVSLEIGVQEEAQPELGDLADVDIATTPPVAGDTLVFDGATWVPAARPVEITRGVEGAPAADQVVLRYLASRALTLPADLAGSQAVAGVAATAQAEFHLRKNGTIVGTIGFAASATVASFSAASAVTLAGGDVLTVVAPTTPDATLADVALALLGAPD